MALGKIKAGMKLADVIAQATGRQLNKIGSKLGMDKDILDGLDKNKIKGAMLDEAQLYMRNKRKNTNRRVGAAAAAGAAATTVAYGVSDFVRDMLGIKSAGDGELSASERPKPSDKKSKKSPISTPKSRPTQRRKKDSEEPTPKPRPKPKAKESTSGVKFIDLTGTPTKRNKGATDFRKGGMVISTVDNRKKR